MLKVNEIFNSINGEVNPFGQGRLTTFVRLTGCNIKCSYCDTNNERCLGEYDVYDLKKFLIPLLRNTKCLCFTGGEPLLQKEELYSFILQTNWINWVNVYIETNGTIDTAPIPKFPFVSFCMDYKTENPPSHENLIRLDCTDVLKIPFKHSHLSETIELLHVLTWDYPKPMKAISLINPQLWRKEDVQDVVRSLSREPLFNKIFFNTQIHKLYDLR